MMFFSFYSLAGYPPFYAKNDVSQRNMIKTANFNFNHSLWRDISNEAKDLIKQLLVVDPNKRLNASEALQHPWFDVSTNI